MSDTSGLSKTFTFFWTIENTNRLFLDHIYSSCFSVQPRSSNQCYLVLKTDNSKGYTEIALRFLGDQDTSESGGFECEISLLKFDGTVFKTVNGRRKFLSRAGFSFPLIKRDDLRNLKNVLYPNNNLVICCRLWCYGKEFQVSNLCYGLTTLENVEDSFIWCIRNFSSLKPGQTRSRRSKLAIASYPPITLNLFLAEGGDDLCIEFTKGYTKMEFITYWRIAIVDLFGKIVYTKFIQWDLTEKKDSLNFVNFIKKSEIVRQKETHLPDDSLILTFSCVLLQESVTVFDLQGTNNLKENSQELNSMGNTLHKRNPATLSIDLIQLFKESFLTDVDLKVGSEKFPAHKAVLSARSPVFKAMFTVDMKEKKESCIELNDIEPDTLRRLLLYMYTDAIEDLQYKTAAALYSAADKYDMIALRKKCSEFLKSKISISNAGELLLLADSHSDKDLKSYVESFFLDQRFEIFRSTHWEKFRKTHLLLASDIMQNILLQIL